MNDIKTKSNNISVKDTNLLYKLWDANWDCITI